MSDSVETTYLGYPIRVDDSTVTVFDKARRKLATVPSVKQARLFIRGYRRAA